MIGSVESVVKHMIKLNNHKSNISFPAVVINTDKLVDGVVDVKPIVNFMNSSTGDTIEYPTIRNVKLLFPSTKNSTISFPVIQGDFVELLFQSVDITDFLNGNTSQHDPFSTGYGNLKNVVAIVGLTPYQDSCFNPNNYSTEFDNQSLNIVHNKNTDNESSISINTNGDITLKSPTKVLVESPEVDVIADTVNNNNANVKTEGDFTLQGRSLLEFMKAYDLHTHIGNLGSPTSTPSI